MKSSRARLLLLAAVAAALLGAFARAQGTHVHSRYSKDARATLVAADTLYVADTPAQFMALRLSCVYPNEGPPSAPPDHISIQFYSYAPAPLYRKDDAHRLTVEADGETLDFGLTGYFLARDDGKGKETYGIEKSSRDIRTLLPPNARVRSAAGGKGLVLEFMSGAGVTLESLTRMSEARKLTVKIGGTTFTLTPEQHEVLREFASAVTPAGGAAQSAVTVGPDIPADVPSDANNATLDATLRWLKKELASESRTTLGEVSESIEPEDFGGCQVSYRLTSVGASRPNKVLPTAADFKLNLADLNPKSVRLSSRASYSTVTFHTRDNEPKIKLASRVYADGYPGRPLYESTVSSGSFNLRTESAGARIKAALVHAIKLCQPAP